MVLCLIRDELCANTLFVVVVAGPYLVGQGQMVVVGCSNIPSVFL